MNQVIAGIDIGGTKIAVAIEDLQGERIATLRLPTRVEMGPYSIIENVSQSIEKVLIEKKVELASIGIGCPAPIDIKKGLVLSPTNLPGWNEFPVVNLFKNRFNVPTALDNDANAATLGEYIYGAGRGYKNLVYITVSTGIGGGIIVDGKIIHGVGAGAGELGHTVVLPDGIRCKCGNVGCLETICSGTHIARRTRERLASGESSLINKLTNGKTEINTELVVEALKRGDRLAIEVWEETCRFLALGIGNIITLLAPEAVIIGGGVAQTGELLLSPLRALLPKYVSMVPIENIDILPAGLGEESGIYGALVIAKNLLSNQFQTYAK